jgi:hypothetical protein
MVGTCKSPFVGGIATVFQYPDNGEMAIPEIGELIGVRFDALCQKAVMLKSK